MAEEKKEHDNKMKKMEAEMEQVFEMKVQEKQSKLKESEADVCIYRVRLYTVIEGPGKTVQTQGVRGWCTYNILL